MVAVFRFSSLPDGPPPMVQVPSDKRTVHSLPFDPDRVHGLPLRRSVEQGRGLPMKRMGLPRQSRRLPSAPSPGRAVMRVRRAVSARGKISLRFRPPVPKLGNGHSPGAGDWNAPPTGNIAPPRQAVVPSDSAVPVPCAGQHATNRRGYAVSRSAPQGRSS